MNSSSDIQFSSMKPKEHVEDVSPACCTEAVLEVSSDTCLSVPPEGGESCIDERTELVELVITEEDSDGPNSVRTRGKLVLLGGDPKPNSRQALSSSL